MYFGAKSRFHDLTTILEVFNPKLVEFHLTDTDILKGNLNGQIYPIDYSVHLPEYWCQVLIDPCNPAEFKNNIDIYRKCLLKSLQLSANFEHTGKLLAVLHPGGASIEQNIDTLRSNDYYKRIGFFVRFLESMPEFSGQLEILLENMPPLPWFYGGQYYSDIFCNPVEIKDFCVRTGRSICMDISHLGLYCNYAGLDLIESIKILKPYTKQIHLADAEGTDGEGVPIGQGNIDFKKVIEEIKDIDCAVIPETMWGHRDNYREFNRVIEECNKWL